MSTPRLVPTTTVGTDDSDLQLASIAVAASVRKLGENVARVVRPIIPSDPAFEMTLTLVIRAGKVRVQVQPEPYRSPGWQDSSR